MTDSTTPVQDDLLGRIAAASNAGRVEELRGLVTQLPIPPKPGPQLVIVNLSSPGAIYTSDMWPHVNKLEASGVGYNLGALLSRIDQSPDVMELIERAVRQVDILHSSDADAVVAAIRTALEGATQ